jgi:MerR family mercuric resistance operon transcriptional regulator
MAVMERGLLTIGELARAADVPTSTVRYYERQGLLEPSRRSASNYRLYSQDDLDRLRFIRAAQATGFTLEHVSKLLRPAPCARVQDLIRERLSQVDAHMRELRHVKRVLGAALETCRKHEATGRCRVVADLTAQAKGRQ